MKCFFNGQPKSQDVVFMDLYKRVYPKWTYQSETPSIAQEEREGQAYSMFDWNIDQKKRKNSENVDTYTPATFDCYLQGEEHKNILLVDYILNNVIWNTSLINEFVFILIKK